MVKNRVLEEEEEEEEEEQEQGRTSRSLMAMAPPPPGKKILTAFHVADDDGQSFPWSLLPAELLDRVLAWLPLRSLLRFRSVCKRWNSLLFSPHFLHFPSHIPCQDPWLIFFTRKTKDFFLAYDFAFHTWRKLPLNFLPHDVSCTGSAGGRILIQSALAVLYICNPLTKLRMALPPFQTIKFSVAQGFAGDHTGKGNKVVVAGNSGANLVTEVYHSSSNSWKVMDSLPRAFVIKHEQMTECNGFFYSLLLKPSGMLVISDGGVDWSLQAMPVEEPRLWPRLVACQKSLFLVGGIEGDHGLESVHIWRFKPEAKDWQMLDRMPPNICEDLCETSSSIWFECVGVGNFICFRVHRSLKVLTYNLCGKSWNWLPHCPYDFDSLLARGFQLEPRLEA